MLTPTSGSLFSLNSIGLVVLSVLRRRPASFSGPGPRPRRSAGQRQPLHPEELRLRQRLHPQPFSWCFSVSIFAPICSSLLWACSCVFMIFFCLRGWNPGIWRSFILYKPKMQQTQENFFKSICFIVRFKLTKHTLGSSITLQSVFRQQHCFSAKSSLTFLTNSSL